MADFGNYAALREDGEKSLPFLFENLRGAPGVQSRPATEANKKYNAARLKRLGKRTGQGRKRQRITLDTVQAAREEDATMLAKYCVTGWASGHVPVDAEGNEVPFSEENARDFFLAIPPEMFDDYRAWVSDPLSFVEETDDDDGDEDAPGELPPSSQNGSSGNSDMNETASQ